MMGGWATALIALALVELGVRLLRWLRDGQALTKPWRLPAPKAVAFEDHPYALYVKKPNCDGRYPTNSLGYAGKREIAPSRRPGSVRLYCVGGSTVEDYDPAQGPDSSWPGKLQDLLSARFPEVPIECINAATAGYTSAESLAEFAFRGVDLRPDLLLVYHNVGDCWTAQMVEGFKSDYSHARRHKPWTLGWANRIPQLPQWWTYQLLRDWVARRFGKANALIYWIADPPWKTVRTFNATAVAAFERNLTNLAAIARTWGCTPVLIKWECDWSARRLPVYLEQTPEATQVYFEFLNANNEAVRRVATRIDGCVFLDVGPFDPQHFSDTIHLSPRGLEEMARRVARGIEPFVRPLVEAQSGTGRAVIAGAECAQH
jgi:lysophospholipase L1-like esterase